MLTAVMCYLFNEDRFIQRGRKISTEGYQNRFCKNMNEYDSLQTLSAKMNVSRRNLNLIAVVRDPLNRFVSGFVNKCLREHVWKRYPDHCNGCKTNLTCFMEKMYTRMRQWSTGAYSKPSFDDNHFFPQNWRCEFNSHLHEYHILKFDTFDPSRFINDLLLNLKHNRVPEKALTVIRTSLTSGRTVHSTKGSEEQQETRKAILSEKYLLDLLIKMYYYDFAFFGFAIPDLLITT
ncbi:hypothetical protein OESDEN_02538 [Oesophagostomum dentatum]|uniref:Carbohydrate sulfotransferase n=1 Tax=Oesophagostomum dentatum TaxID=61180 RepID=A0A0B1TJP5_OESDE|nr:hypothetical protein OESDEN_02538 [Oesophagostomum dentatum]